MVFCASLRSYLLTIKVSVRTSHWGKPGLLHIGKTRAPAGFSQTTHNSGYTPQLLELETREGYCENLTLLENTGLPFSRE